MFFVVMHALVLYLYENTNIVFYASIVIVIKSPTACILSLVCMQDICVGI